MMARVQSTLHSAQSILRPFQFIEHLLKQAEGILAFGIEIVRIINTFQNLVETVEGTQLLEPKSLLLIKI